MVISMVVLGDHWKYSHFAFSGRMGKKNWVGKLVIIQDIERSKMVESMHMEMGESEKTQWYEISFTPGEDISQVQ